MAADSDRPRRTPYSSGAPASRVVLVLLPLGLAVAVLLRHSAHFVGVDFDVYRGGGTTVLAGAPLYDFASAIQLPFTYPPAAALVFVPLGLVPAAVAAAVWTFLSLCALEALIWLVLRRVGRPGPVARLRWTAVATVLSLPLGPVLFNGWVGQINVFLLLLVVADVFGRTGRWRGVAIGIAAGIKLTPLIFIPYLLCTRRFRAAATATASFAATVAAGFLVLPADSARYWLQHAADVGRITQGDDVPFFNGSLRGLLVRLAVPHVTATYLVLAAVVGVLGLAVAVWAGRRGDDVVGVLACGFTGLLVSPVSWVFHWVWLVPLLVVWAARAWRDGLTGEKYGVAALWLACAGSGYWVVLNLVLAPVPEPVALVFANLWPVVGVGVLVAFAWHLRHTAQHWRCPASSGSVKLSAQVNSSGRNGFRRTSTTESRR